MKKTIGILVFSKHTDHPLRERINSRFIEEINSAGYQPQIFYYDLFSVFYEKNKLEIYYQNKKFNPKKYLFFISQYYFLNAEFANNIFIVECLTQLGLKVFNSLSGATAAKNKRESLLKLALNKLPIIPTGINFSQFFLDEQLRRRQHSKIIAKANIGSMGYGVGLFDSPISFISFMEFSGNKEQPVNLLIQPFIDSKNEDYRVFVIGNKVVTTLKRYANGIEFRANISKGGGGKEIKASKKMADLAIQATKTLDLDYAGVDILKDAKGRLYLIEVNSNPGLEIEKITGVNVVKEIIEYCIKKTK